MSKSKTLRTIKEGMEYLAKKGWTPKQIQKLLNEIQRQKKLTFKDKVWRLHLPKNPPRRH